LVTIEGTLEELVYTNEITGYTVCDIRLGKETVTAVGYMPFVNAGETLKVTGKWVMHPDYGKQLKVEMYEKVLPQTTDAIEKYLASGVIKGVGPVTSARIVERFGEDTLDIIQLRPEMLSEIKGISMRKAIAIGTAFNEQNELRSVVMFFQQYGISPTYSAKIYRVFGNNTIEEIKSNPYKLADQIFGIGFKTADRIAMSLGIDAASKYRICSGIKYVLSQAASNGHTFVPEDKLREYTSQLLQVELEDINHALISLALDKSVYTEKADKENRVYLGSFYNAEINVCKKLIELSDIRFECDIDGLDGIIDEVQREDGIILADNQRTAVRESLLNGVIVITGGPGTGKTTIIKSIVKVLDKKGYRVALAAPTGRAAKRMTEASGYEAKTIHRLLEIGYSSDEDELVFNHTEYNPIDADVIIIDEASMVDILLMNHLLKAIKPGTRLILVGDINQLPSVGAGNVLRDIISSRMVKTVRLKEIFRQAEESMIIVNAHRINRGDYPHLNVKGKDFFFLSRGSGSSIVDTIIELVTVRIPQTYGYDPLKHIQVLTPSRKGPVGVAKLNIELQKALNPKRRNKCERSFREYTFRVGDRVMQVKNNYSLRWEKPGRPYTEGVGVFNGDTGVINRIDDEEQVLEVLFEDERIVEYDFSILDEIEPAFATTIHKSQGSEFPVVIMPVHPGPPVLMTRNLLYTAVTRARDLVVLVGSQSVLGSMINNQKEILRYSGLGEKLQSYITKMDWLEKEGV
jgi:exodeoxyribonuclease V alpha subunit